MSQRVYDKDSLRRYLLGAASADESAQLDELSLTDDDCALALALAENELVDAYARSSLSSSEHDQFERHYLASPLRREKAHFALELQRIASRVSVALPAVKSEPRGRSTPFIWLNLRPIWQGVFATAAVILLATSLWLVAQNRRLRIESEAQRSALAQRVSELETGKSITENNQTELARLREQLAQVEVRPGASTPPLAADDQSLFAFVLAAPIRGMAGVRKIEVPSQSSMVEAKLELENEADARYRVALRDPLTARILWQSGKLRVVKGRNGATLNVRLPASLLTPRRYAFEVLALTANNTEEPLANYPFEVSRP